MIESIHITETFPFTEIDYSLNASKVNFLFGANGVGKTTISRIIANPIEYPKTTLNWVKGQKLQTFVLNRDFVKENFGADQIKGVFTLGKEQKDTREKISIAQDNIERHKASLASINQQLYGENGKISELKNVQTRFKERCWEETRQYKEVFRDALKNTLNSKKSFMNKLLHEYKNNQASSHSVEDLRARAEILFGEPPQAVDDVPMIVGSSLQGHNLNPILDKPVIGKGDVDIAAMIERLENSDWVKQGRIYYDRNDSICPFCQQNTSRDFSSRLEDYFDESYEKDMEDIGNLVSAYQRDAEALEKQIKQLLNTPNLYLNAEELTAQKRILEGLVRENLQALERKREAPTTRVKLRSIDAVLEAIDKLREEAHQKVSEHNKIVRNFKNEKRRLIAEVWRFLLNKLHTNLSMYEQDRSSLEKAITGLKESEANTKKKIVDLRREIQELERQTTNIRTTVNEINAILKQFGFTSFHLAVSPDEQHYQILRSNGELVADTLSEGEKTFVVFLYFYNLLRGSQSEDGINESRVVVFDDPVSSLDSDILFVVSSLIRRICVDVCKQRGNIKQVFVLTHNVYFHREVAFWRYSNEVKSKDKSFWVVRKRKNSSFIEWYENNPIKTSYDLLWGEVREASSFNPGLPNAMRRILEYYFKTIGGKDLDELKDGFEGKDKLICQMLLSWAHSGSHNILEPDLHVPSDGEIEAYKRIFREIFEVHGHEGHYRMMMRLASSDKSDNDTIMIASSPVDQESDIAPSEA